MATESKELKKLRRVFSSMKLDVKEFIDRYYNVLVDDLNAALFNISLVRNTNGQTFEDIEISASSTLRIYHRLNVLPSYKIIIKQSGNSLITDGEFTDDYIELINNGANDVVASFILFRE